MNIDKEREREEQRMEKNAQTEQVKKYGSNRSQEADGYYDGYCDGQLAEYNYRLSQGPNMIVKWVNAGDRLPPYRKRVPAKKITEHGETYGQIVVTGNRMTTYDQVATNFPGLPDLINSNNKEELSEYWWFKEIILSKPQNTSEMGENPLNGLLSGDIRTQMDKEAIKIHLAGEDHKLWERGCKWMYWAFMKWLAKETSTNK